VQTAGLGPAAARRAPRRRARGEVLRGETRATRNRWLRVMRLAAR